MNTQEAYIRGFMSKCAEYGIDPELLLKHAGFYQYRGPGGKLVTGTANGGESYSNYVNRDVNGIPSGRYLVTSNGGMTYRDATTEVNQNKTKDAPPPVAAGTVAGKGVPDSAARAMEMPPVSATTGTTVSERDARAREATARMTESGYTPKATTIPRS